ncbi:hypothetical protein, partial [Poseidonocella sp. HB161398]|uniref:hypothetical protein n=1 Tax=Poseidonocella sp. HB161398 TaxID=2320855 RepID=UPI00197CC37A
MPAYAAERIMEFDREAALLRKSADDRTSPFPGDAYPAATVIGIPIAVKRLRNERQAPLVRAQPR